MSGRVSDEVTLEQRPDGSEGWEEELGRCLREEQIESEEVEAQWCVDKKVRRALNGQHTGQRRGRWSLREKGGLKQALCRISWGIFRFLAFTLSDSA